MTELLVVRSKLRDVVIDFAKQLDKEKGKGNGNFNVSGDFADALSVKVEQLINDAVRRAHVNKRRTVMAHDL